MTYFLSLTQKEVSRAAIILNFGNNQASRGAVIAGLWSVRDQIKLEAWDIDDKEKRWDKEI